MTVNNNDIILTCFAGSQDPSNMYFSRESIFFTLFVPFEKFIPIFATTGTDIKKTGGIIRDDIRRIAAMGNDSVDTTIGSQMLPICVYTVVGQNQGIQGVNACSML